jgi:hypothetical protein
VYCYQKCDFFAFFEVEPDLFKQNHALRYEEYEESVKDNKCLWIDGNVQNIFRFIDSIILQSECFGCCYWD